MPFMAQNPINEGKNADLLRSSSRNTDDQLLLDSTEDQDVKRLVCSRRFGHESIQLCSAALTADSFKY